MPAPVGPRPTFSSPTNFWSETRSSAPRLQSAKPPPKKPPSDRRRPSASGPTAELAGLIPIALRRAIFWTAQQISRISGTADQKNKPGPRRMQESQARTRSKNEGHTAMATETKKPNERRALGKGLDSLLPRVQAASTP